MNGIVASFLAGAVGGGVASTAAASATKPKDGKNGKNGKDGVDGADGMKFTPGQVTAADLVLTSADVGTLVYYSA